MPNILFPAGRLVYGHPSKLIAKTDNKRQPVLKDGKPVMVRSFGVAYDKATFNSQIWPIMYQAASAAFGGQQPPPHFSYKFKDGDSIDRQGRPYNQREGYAGHCVVHFETQFDLHAYRLNAQTGGSDQITENDYKTGDYIQVNADIEGNKPADPTHTPGLFINPKGVLHVGNGTAIINAPSADQMFAGVNPAALPPGATAPGTPSPMPAGMANPPGFGQQPSALPPGAMQPPPAAPAAPAAPVYQQPSVPGFAPQAPQFQAPATGYMPQPGQPAAPAAAPVPGFAPQQPQFQSPATGYPPQPGQPAAAPVPGQPVYPPAHDFVAAATGQPVPGQMPGQPAAAPVPGQPGYPTMPPGAQPPR